MLRNNNIKFVNTFALIKSIIVPTNVTITTFLTKMKLFLKQFRNIVKGKIINL